MEVEEIVLAWEGDIAIISLARPQALNALTLPMAGAFRAALDSVHDKARALVVTGEGKAFCAGADLSAGGGVGGPLDRHAAGGGLEAMYHPLIREISALPLPVISAVNGAAVGLGASLALCADLVVAARSAYFLFAFLKVGLVPDGGATFLLSRSVGRVRAMEILLLGERLAAPEALDWGLINRVAGDGEALETALVLARRLADGPVSSLAATRRLVWRSLEAGWVEQLHLEREAQREASLGDDFHEGVAAFRGKRKPDFRGRH